VSYKEKHRILTCSLSVKSAGRIWHFNSQFPQILLVLFAVTSESSSAYSKLTASFNRLTENDSRFNFLIITFCSADDTSQRYNKGLKQTIYPQITK